MPSIASLALLFPPTPKPLLCSPFNGNQEKNSAQYRRHTGQVILRIHIRSYRSCARSILSETDSDGHQFGFALDCLRLTGAAKRSTDIRSGGWNHLVVEE
jgi:hypothetical protein